MGCANGSAKMTAEPRYHGDVDIRRLADARFAEAVARARAMDAGDKLLEGPRLFARAARLMADGIRHAHPELDEAGVERLLVERLQRLRRLEQP
jgi:hypothetical protein